MVKGLHNQLLLNGSTNAGMGLGLSEAMRIFWFGSILLDKCERFDKYLPHIMSEASRNFWFISKLPFPKTMKFNMGYIILLLLLLLHNIYFIIVQHVGRYVNSIKLCHQG